MRDLDQLREAVRGVDVVFHLGAAVGVGQSMYEIAHYMGANTQGTANLLQALLDTEGKLEKLIVASSMSIYGEGKYLLRAMWQAVAPRERSGKQLKEQSGSRSCPACGRELTPIPTDESKPLQCSSFYALSKKDQEEMVLLFGTTYGLPVVALRYFNIYGARQSLSNPYTGVAAIFASRLLNGRAPLVFEDGMQMRDFVSVHDVVRANLLAMEKTEAEGMALNIGSGEPISIREVAGIMGAALGIDIDTGDHGEVSRGRYPPLLWRYKRGESCAGLSAAVRFAEGIQDTANWLREQHAEDRAAEMVQKLHEYRLTA